jgi:hypothetical protein
MLSSLRKLSTLLRLRVSSSVTTFASPTISRSPETMACLLRFVAALLRVVVSC